MTNDSYTPSPWYYVTGAVWTTPEGPDDGGECIAMRASAANIQPTTRDANLRLCSAAPEMLEALKGLFEHCSMIHKHWGEGSNATEAREAIAFAEATILKAGGGQ
jgi:hypothetical protein